ncbi:hypothetical protein [Halobacteriovorax sp. JY17]|uniref:hypothetical protein n=1 Tax=Halobacteriovorax sp. JY17 TaxID=2014617 RepID=UPI000C5FC13E|nr:hypothetical protein [Halobacteriovorax sp. JY17]PIK16102.1 MAG: hypothetical protein CES88_05050 [Halobacteriovorax sp. JY17]
MKIYSLFIFSLLFTLSSFSAVVESSWNDQYQKEISFYCGENDTLCSDLCGEATMCKVPEETCHNCIGTSITLTYIFNYMSKAYTNTGVSALSGDVLELLKSGDFVTFSSRSIYNHVDSFNSMTLRQNFKKLCSDGTRYPIVIFNKSKRTQKVSDVRFVFCNDGIYEMNFSNDLILNFEENQKNTLF